MDRYEAARELRVADADVLGVEDSEHGTVVEMRDGGRLLIAQTGVFSLSDHAGWRTLRRWEPPAAEAEQEPAEAEEKPAPKPKTPRTRKAPSS